jgi:hypothetical protein
MLQRQDSPWAVILDSYCFGEAIGPRRARTLQGRSAIKASSVTTDLGWGGATVSIAIHMPSCLLRSFVGDALVEARSVDLLGEALACP